VRKSGAAHFLYPFVSVVNGGGGGVGGAIAIAQSVLQNYAFLVTWANLPPFPPRSVGSLERKALDVGRIQRKYQCVCKDFPCFEITTCPAVGAVMRRPERSNIMSDEALERASTPAAEWRLSMPVGATNFPVLR